MIIPVFPSTICIQRPRRNVNALHKLPYELAKEHNASGYVLQELEKADKVARDAEVGILAWLWG